MTKKNNSKCPTMNMPAFLNYLQLEQNRDYELLLTASHKELKSLMPALKKISVSFEEAEKDCTKHIIVYDYNGNAGAYINICTRNLDHLIGDTTMISQPVNAYIPKDLGPYKKKHTKKKNKTRKKGANKPLDRD